MTGSDKAERKINKTPSQVLWEKCPSFNYCPYKPMSDRCVGIEFNVNE